MTSPKGGTRGGLGVGRAATSPDNLRPTQEFEGAPPLPAVGKGGDFDFWASKCRD